jgi:hypothetical protein
MTIWKEEAAVVFWGEIRGLITLQPHLCHLEARVGSLRFDHDILDLEGGLFVLHLDVGVIGSSQTYRRRAEEAKRFSARLACW